MIIIKVKQVRMAKGMTQRQLSIASGVSKSQIDRIEKGEIRAALEDMCEIARALGVPLDAIHEYHYIENPQP